MAHQLKPYVYDIYKRLSVTYIEGKARATNAYKTYLKRFSRGTHAKLGKSTTVRVDFHSVETYGFLLFLPHLI